MAAPGSNGDVAFIGLGAMGSGMAAHLVKQGFAVCGFDVYGPSMAKLQAAGGKAAASPAEAAQDAALLVVMVTNSDQAESVLFGEKGAAAALAKGATVVLCSTVPPDFVRGLERKLASLGLLLVDAPVSGGVVRAAAGTLTIMAAGSPEALQNAEQVLKALSENLYIIPGGAGSGSNVKMVNQLLAGVHIAAAAEAIALGARAGLDTRLLYDIISKAAGNSWMFENRVPHMLEQDYAPKSALDIFVKDLGIVLGEAKGLKWPLPLSAAAHQQFLAGSAAGLGREDDAGVVRVFEKLSGVSVAAPKPPRAPLALPPADPNAPKPAVGFIGLGAMGGGMAINLVKTGFHVTGFDVYPPSVERLTSAGGSAGSSPAATAKGADVLVIMVTNSDQAEAVLFGEAGAVPALSDGATVVLCSTVPPDYVRSLTSRLEGEGRGLRLVDAPVSGGVAKAADGTLTIMAAGSDDALAGAASVLRAMSENLYVIPGGAGAGSNVKMVNQLLAGVHIAAAAEAVALGARAGLDTRLLYDIISKAAGSSWMFVNRVPHMLDNDYTPKSALDIFVKDLGIVLGEAKSLKFPLPLAAQAHQLFLLGSAAGFGREDDAAVVKVYEKLAGVSAAAPLPLNPSNLAAAPSSSPSSTPTLSLQATLAALPPEWPEDPLPEIQEAVGAKNRARPVMVVLDDDPTGTQTVHGVAVLTEWSVESLTAELAGRPPCLFVLTNSRALHTDEAAALTSEICRNLVAAADAAGHLPFTVVLRGDSTLRGHFPQEPEAAAAVLGETDAWLLAPFFLQGGRYTIGDVHYVADGDRLVPAGETEFAKDAAFGYRSSNLKEWVEEKTGGRMTIANVASVSLETIRQGGPEAVAKELLSLKKGAVCVVNAASERDMRVFAAGMLRAEAAGRRFLCRTAAAFVSASAGIEPRPPLGPADLKVTRKSCRGHGGLIVVGSYVPKTTAQVEELLRLRGNELEQLTVSVAAVASDDAAVREEEIARTVRRTEAALRSGRDTLIMTSRKLVTGTNAASSLAIGGRVSSAVVEIVRRIQVEPRYLLAKGGITSSDLAVKAMGATRAEVAGQALPGVPLWRLGPGSRYPGVPYIVFPGNVGGKDAIAQVVATWALPPAPTTSGLLESAREGGYAVGAFNVYNLEGVAAVVAAAEALQSPAILQIHPGSLDHGGRPLVACCLAAARDAAVPITVHLDHGAKEDDVMAALQLGFDSVMVDGSHLPYDENVAYTRRVARAAHARGMAVEAELGRLSGTEDGLTVQEYEAKLTDVQQARDFLAATKIDALAVCIGNVHGKYPASGPKIDLDRLQALREAAGSTTLVLHGASGLPEDLVKACIRAGVTKFNVNTEVRAAYLESLRQQSGARDLVDVMRAAGEAMQAVVAEKMRMFGSVGKTPFS